jgi:hypothetical protein
MIKSIFAAMAIAVLFSSIVSLAHAQVTMTTRVAELGKPFELKFGQKASINSEKIDITFTGLIEDSRCPSDVVCIQAGQATIEVSVMVNGTDAGRQNLTVGPRGNESATFGQYLVRLEKLDPYPVSTKQTAQEDYVATLVVSKASANATFVKARGDFFVISGWKGDKGTLVTVGRDPDGGPRREVIRFVPVEAKCIKPDATSCIDGQETNSNSTQNIHLEIAGSKLLYLTLQGTEYSLDVKQIKMK